ncbi:hypothetical protein FZC15_24025 [Escherichia coli]|nr:hypothetical protein [Escherichia coli]
MNIHQANQQTIRIMCQGLLQRVQKGVMPYFECGKCPAPWILRKSGWRSVFSEFPDTGLVVLAIGPAQQFFRAPDGQRKRKLTAVCSHQTRIGNLDAHLI